MHLVLGHSILARALATHSARRGPTVLACAQELEGPFMWRYADLSTGEGVRAAAQGATSVAIVLDEDDPPEAHGAFVVLKSRAPTRGCVVVGVDQPPPPGAADHPEWARIQCAPTWGPYHPLWKGWAEAIHQGRATWVPNPGPVAPVREERVTEALMACLDRPGSVWRLAGPTTSFPELAAGLGAAQASQAKRPLWLAARHHGATPAQLRRMLRASAGDMDTPGWAQPDETGGVDD